VCWQATGIVDSFVNQVLRATVDTDQLSGPDFRLTVDNNGICRAIMQRWPVTSILAAQVSPNATFPRQWSPIPAGSWDIETPVLGVYGSSAPSSSGEGGQAILIQPGYVNWCAGRNGYRLSASYLNGWPHTSLTAEVEAGASTIEVDDVTGFGITDVAGFTGASAFAYDGASTETVTVSAVSADSMMTLPNSGGTVAAGPGTLTLSSPLTFSHGVGVMVSSLPQNILWATALAATVQALESGIQAITVQNIPGSMTTGGHGTAALETQYQDLLKPFKRVI
jgi:hypothetical protein